MFQFLFCNLFILIQQFLIFLIITNNETILPHLSLKINIPRFFFHYVPCLFFSSKKMKEKSERYKAHYIYPWHRTMILFNIVLTLPSMRKNLRDNRRIS